MKKQIGTKKMTLSRETLRALETGEIRHIHGANTLQAGCTDVTICVSCRPGSTCL